jgi:3-oxoadipate enol-lactonase
MNPRLINNLAINVQDLLWTNLIKATGVDLHYPQRLPQIEVNIRFNFACCKVPFLETASTPKMYYEDYGRELERTVLLIHPIGGNTEIWNDEIKIMLRRNFRVIAYDLRGHGKSDVGNVQAYTMNDLVNDLRTLLDHLEVKNCVIVGHSIGGQIACIFAVTFPERVKGLVIISSSSEVIPDADLEKHHATRRIAREQGMSALAKETMNEHEVAREAFKDNKKRETFTRIFTETSVEGFSAATVALYSIPCTVSKKLAETSIPISGIVGSDDDVFMRLMRQMQEEIPRMKLKIVKGDHWVIVESHEAFDEALVQAIKETGA